MRGAADVLGAEASVEAAWLRGAADLVERDEAERHAVRAQAMWLEELTSEARARKTAVLSAWVGAAEALRTAIHALESERGPLVESLFPEWRGPSLRRHADQARAAESELQRRLASGYVVRRLAELATHDALGAALEGLAAAGTAWAADRDRLSLAGPGGDAVRAGLLALAGRTAHLLERVRWVVRAALADRPELVEEVFPKRTRPAPTAAGGAPAAETDAADPGLATELVAGASPGTMAPTRPRWKTARRDPARSDENDAESAGAAPGPDARASSESAGPDTTPRGKLRSRRPDVGATREADAPVTATTDAAPERRSATRPARPGRATGKPRSSQTSASSPAGRSTRTPESSAAAAPDPQKPSARESGRRRRPPRRS